MITGGFYSVVRYSSDPLRDESKNVALLLVDQERDRACLRIAPLSQVTPRLTEHGVLDGLLVNLAARLEAKELMDRGRLADLQRAIGPTVTITTPVPAAIQDDMGATLRSLYEAYVAPRRGRTTGMSHGQLLDRLVKACRTAGANVAPGTYVDDILFDALITSPESRTPVQVLSFESEADSVRGIEQAAGHFLYGLRRIHTEGVCVIQPPFARSSDNARMSYRRVSRWMSDEGVGVVKPDEMARLATSMAGADPLPLVMST